ncbi:EamA family transporter [Pistricoccus aurantiacus]|uniref:EamA family transporter n=1 Tax=Pistricoccus aurantiacus TaxID=1883414 RepID=A0A5B8T0Z6_9GAMM|nr:EamA family transporter [Pistricoccus aurantiacus]QEA40728.1 EamA family transporter [Pistricoccus aurantiacus]
MPLRDLLLGLGVIAIWALNVIVIKIGVDHFPPLLMTALRFVLVAAILVPFRPVSRSQLPFLLLISFVFGTLHFAMLFIGLSQAEAGTGALLAQMGTPFATILAAIFLKEAIDAPRLGGLVLSFAGVAVLVGGPTLPPPLATAALFISATGWATSQLLIKHGPPIPPLTLAGWMALFAVPQLILESWWFESGQLSAMQEAGWAGWGAVFYTAVMSSIVAYGIWYGLLRRHPINRVVPLTLLIPVGAVLLGVLLLDEGLGLNKLLGGSLVVLGIAMIVLYPQRRNLSAKPNRRS